MDGLTEISIKQECADLVAAYSFAVNDRDLDAFVDLFTEDAVWQRPNVPALDGRGEIQAFMAERNDVDRVQRHVNGAVQVIVHDENRASIRSQCIVFSHNAACPLPAPLERARMVVEYEDEAVRTDEGFKFKRRDTVVVFTDSESKAAYADLAEKLRASADPVMR
jgi:hypothetical protein